MMRFTLYLLVLSISVLLHANTPFPQIIQQGATLQWQASDDDVHYLLYGSGEPDFALEDPFINDPHLQTVLNEPSLPLGLPLPYYRLVAYHQDGNFSEPSAVIDLKNAERTYPKFTRDQWMAVGSAIMPDKHPAKPLMDKLFKAKRVTASVDTLKEAGFTVKGPGSGQTLVVRHPKINNVLIKLYTDDQPIDDFSSLYNRVIGAALAREIIKARQFEWLFKVPRKWFYILPETPVALGPYPKQLVLVVEDMNILPKDENYPKWKSSSMTKQKLDAIYILLTEGGFNDLGLAFNLPFSKDGRLAVVDTEDYRKWPIPYNRLNKYLSNKMSEYWNALIAQGGPAGYHASKPLKHLMKLNSCKPPMLHSEDINP